MSWGAQVAHVLRKDLRQQRWLILAYAAFIALAVGTGMLGRLIGGLHFASVAALLIFGALLTVMVVQSDSPAEVNAHWATLPLDPLAVLAAKSVYLLLIVVALPVFGQVLLTIPLGVDPPHVGRVLAVATAVYGSWIALCFAVAVLFRDVASYFVGFLLLLIGAVAVTAILAELTGRTMSLPAVAALALILVVPAYLYVTRRLERARGLAVLSLVLIGLTDVRTTGTLPNLSDEPIARPAVFSEIPLEIRPELRVAGARVARPVAVAASLDLSLDLSVTIDGPTEGFLYQVVPRAAYVARADGTSDRVPLPTYVARTGGTIGRVPLSPGSVYVPAPVLPEARSYTWLGAAPQMSMNVQARLDSEHAPATGDHPGVGVEVEVFVARRVVAEDLPLERSSRRRVPDGWLRIDAVEWDEHEITGQIAISAFGAIPWLRPSAAVLGSPNQPIVIALLNAERREAILMQGGSRWTSSCCFIIPGNLASHTAVSLHVDARVRQMLSEGELDEGWLRAARLHVAVYELMGSYVQRVEATP